MIEYEVKVMDDNNTEFTHPSNSQLRIIRDDHKYWYCAVDIAKLLGNVNYTAIPHRFTVSLDKLLVKEQRKGEDRKPSDYYKYIQCEVKTIRGLRKFDFIYLTYLGLKTTLERSRNINAENLLDRINKLVTELYLISMEDGEKAVANLKEKVIYLEK